MGCFTHTLAYSELSECVRLTCGSCQIATFQTGVALSLFEHAPAFLVWFSAYELIDYVAISIIMNVACLSEFEQHFA